MVVVDLEFQVELQQVVVQEEEVEVHYQQQVQEIVHQ